MFVELPVVDPILKLCLDIYLAREMCELELEESLFAKLLCIYREPSILFKITRYDWPAQTGDGAAS